MACYVVAMNLILLVVVLLLLFGGGGFYFGGPAIGGGGLGLDLPCHLFHGRISREELSEQQRRRFG